MNWRQKSAARYLWHLACGCTIPLLLVVLLNLCVDPYRVFHASWWEATYPRDPHRLVPGLIRTSRYDAVIAGTSHCDNFLPASVDRQLGRQALRITLPGSHFEDQQLAVELALRTGQVREVLWGLDLFAFYPSSQLRDVGEQPFPQDYYRPGLRQPLNYLLSLDTANESLRVLAGRGDRGLNLRGTWHTRYDFSESAALQRAVNQLQRAWKIEQAQRALGWSVVEQTLARQLEPLLRAQPDVTFRLLLPPISQLGYIPEFLGDEPTFENRLKFRAWLAERLTALPNVRVYDFEVASEITSDLSHYMDLTHFGVEINEWMLEQIAADRYRLTPETLPAHQEQFLQRTEAAMQTLLTGHHPWSRQLRLESYPHAEGLSRRLVATREVPPDIQQR